MEVDGPGQIETLILRVNDFKTEDKIRVDLWPENTSEIDKNEDDTLENDTELFNALKETNSNKISSKIINKFNNLPAEEISRILQSIGQNLHELSILCSTICCEYILVNNDKITPLLLSDIILQKIVEKEDGYIPLIFQLSNYSPGIVAEHLIFPLIDSDNYEIVLNILNKLHNPRLNVAVLKFWFEEKISILSQTEFIFLKEILKLCPCNFDIRLNIYKFIESFGSQSSKETYLNELNNLIM